MQLFKATCICDALYNMQNSGSCAKPYYGHIRESYEIIHTAYRLAVKLRFKFQRLAFE
jgi:hypothetical protein